MNDGRSPAETLIPRRGGSLFRIALLLLLLGLLAGGSDIAQAAPRTSSGLLKNLTPDQRGRLNQIYHRYYPRKEALSRRVRVLRTQVIGMIQSDHPDRTSIKRVLDTIFDLEGRRQQLVIDEYFDVMAVLRPEQQRSYRDELVQHLAEEQ